VGASGAITRQAAGSTPTAPVLIAICCLTVILALVLGVGLASNLVVRHMVQTAPLWIGVTLGFRRSPATSWTALPCCLFWLLLMALIWSYLLGISHLVSGHFSQIEIAMTIIVGTASIFGIAGCLRFRSFLSPARRVASFVLMAVVQLVCFRLSLLPAVARR
jgi:hypothetical protein